MLVAAMADHVTIVWRMQMQVEDIGPVSYCGGSGPSTQARAAAASAAGVAAATTKQDGKKKVRWVPEDCVFGHA